MNFYKFFKNIFPGFCYLFFLILTVECLLRAVVFINSKINPPGKFYKSGFYNIVCIGDSFTYGWGVDRQNTYPKQLEAVLNGHMAGRMKFKVFNLGIPGSNSSQHLILVREIAASNNKPDLIILLTGANDAWNLADSNLYEFSRQWQARGYPTIKIRTMLSNLKIYKMLKVIFLNMRGITKESGIDTFKIIPKYENIDVDILKKLLGYNLTKIIDICKDNEVKIVLQNYPRGDLYGKSDIEAISLANTAPFVDNYRNFNRELAMVKLRDLFLYDNSHPNERGYRIMAVGLSESIAQMTSE